MAAAVGLDDGHKSTEQTVYLPAASGTRHAPVNRPDVANLSVSELIFLDMHFQTLLTFRLQRPHIALQTFRFQHIISAHVTLLPPSSGPNAISVPMPQGYTNMDTGNLDTWRANHEATIAPGAGRSEKLHITSSICKMIPQAF